jgi:hypothetical protein
MRKSIILIGLFFILPSSAFATTFYSQITGAIGVISPVAPSRTVAQIFTPTSSGTALRIAFNPLDVNHTGGTFCDQQGTTGLTWYAEIVASTTSANDTNRARYNSTHVAPDSAGYCYYNFVSGVGTMSTGSLVSGTSYMLLFSGMGSGTQNLQNGFNASASGSGAGYIQSTGAYTAGGIGANSLNAYITSDSTFTASGIGLVDSVFYSVFPDDNLTLPTSTLPLPYTASGYLAPKDRNGTVDVNWNVYSQSQDLLGNCIDVICATNSIHLGYDYNFDISGQGLFSIATSTTTILPTGWYKMTTTMVRRGGVWSFLSVFDSFGTHFGDQIIVSTTTSFLIATSSANDLLLNITKGQPAGINPVTHSPIIASTTIANLGTCGLSTSFSVVNCLQALFVPDLISLGTVWDTAKNGFLSAVPWGYITLIVTDLNSTATSTLSNFTISTPSNFPIHNTLSLDVFGSLPTASSSMFATATSSSGATFRGTFEPYWNTIIAMIFGLAVMRLLVGTHGNNQSKPEIV